MLIPLIDQLSLGMGVTPTETGEGLPVVGASCDISDTRCYPSGRLGDVSNASGWVVLDHPAADANTGATDKAFAASH
jgi:hypothetical protein